MKTSQVVGGIYKHGKWRKAHFYEKQQRNHRSLFINRKINEKQIKEVNPDSYKERT